MRRLSWLVAWSALFTGGCASTCGLNGGACSSSSHVLPTSACGGSDCQGAPKSDIKPCWYPTLHKYSPHLDEWATKHTALKQANKKLFSSQLHCMRMLPMTYKDGFRQAYIDVANGGDGSTPPVPPPKYWNTKYRSEYGQQQVSSWFDGYREGAAAALVDLDSMRQVGSSGDWQMPNKPCDRNCTIGTGTSRFALNNCPTGNCYAGGGGQSMCANGACSAMAPMGAHYGAMSSGYGDDLGWAPPPMAMASGDPYQFDQPDPMYAPQPDPLMLPQPPYAPPMAPQPQIQLQPMMSAPMVQAMPQAPVMHAPIPQAPIMPAPVPQAPTMHGPVLQMPAMPPVRPVPAVPQSQPTMGGLQPGYSTNPAPRPAAPGKATGPLPILTPGYSTGGGSSPGSNLPPEPLAY